MGSLMRYLRLRMTGRIGLRRRDIRGTDTLHTSESRWAAQRLQSGTHRLNRHYFPLAWIRALTAHRWKNS